MRKGQIMFGTFQPDMQRQEAMQATEVQPIDDSTSGKSWLASAYCFPAEQNLLPDCRGFGP
jgi:hypothetical protein